MGQIWGELKQSLRSLYRSRGLSLAALICLALGIGANVAIFSVVDAVALRSIPFAEPDRLVSVTEYFVRPGSEAEPVAVSAVTFEALQEQEGLAAIGAYDTGTVNLTGQGEPERLESAWATPGLFSTLEVEAVLGHTFLPEEAQPNGPDVVLLGHGLWRQRFGSDPAVVGRSMVLDNVAHTIVGVLPERFDFPARSQLWLPLVDEFDAPEQRYWRVMYSVARLPKEQSLAQAQHRLDALSSQLQQRSPENYTGWALVARPLHDEVVGSVRPVALALMVGVGFVLAIACVNVANMLLARGAARGRLTALRSALGASRLRLIRHSLIESVLLALGGGVLGLVLAAFSLRPLLALTPAESHTFSGVTINPRVFGFALAVSIATGLVAGLIPALRNQRINIQAVLRGSSHGVSAGSHQKLQGALVISEIAVTLILLVAAGLLIASLHAMRDEDPGFDTGGLLTFRINIPNSSYGDRPRQLAFFEGVLSRLEEISGVEAAGLTTTLPLADRDRALTVRFSVRNQPPASPGAVEVTPYRMITPGYLEALGIELRSGRNFRPSDTADTAGVILVSESMGELYWPGENPLGKQIKRGVFDSASPWLTVVGVVEDVKDEGLARSPGPIWYHPFAQRAQVFASLVLRTRREPLSLVPQVRSAVREVDSNVPIFSVRTMEEVLAEASALGRFSSFLAAAFAILGLLLAGIGLYGVIAYAVNLRRREIGIRMALGAQRRDVLAQVFRQGQTLTFLGLGVGLGGSLLTTWLLESLLYGIRPQDPKVIVSAVVTLAAIAALATYLPARRATRIDPLIALRSD